MSSDHTDAMQSLLNESVSQGVPGISVAIANGAGVLWKGCAGVSCIDTRHPMSADMPLGIGSITKTFVATVILQLVEAGELRLEDTATKFLGSAIEAVPGAATATVDQLL